MKYKNGDEVLVKARIFNGSNGVYYVTTKNSAYYANETEIQPIPDMNAEEAWEIAKNLFADYSDMELDEIFGKGWSFPKLMELTPQQAKEKIEAWEAEKEIKVGDVVIFRNYGEYAIVTNIYTDEFINVVFENGKTGLYTKNSIRKTGRHIDIEGFLSQIGGEQ